MTYEEVVRKKKASYYQRNKEKWKLYRENLQKRLGGKDGMNKYYAQRTAEYRLRHPDKIKAYQEKCSKEQTWKKYYYGNLEYQRFRRREWEWKNRRKQGILLRSQIRGENHPHYRGAKICPTCKGVKACFARECRSCSSLTNRGQKHWSWKGGHTGFRKSIYSTKKYVQWRASVFERDNYICQMCYVRGGQLEAHHIKRMIVIIRELIPNPEQLPGWKVRDRLMHYEPIWNVSNGITLCKPCHKEESKNDKRLIAAALKKVN